MDNKKLAAAVAAVYACVKTSEEAAAMQAAESAAVEGSGAGAQIPGQMPNVWGLSGRQAQMQGGTMMQLRMFK